MAGLCVSPAPYLPFTDPHQSRPPGLFALSPDRWTEQDAAFAAQMALRDRLIQEQPDLVALALPEASAALAEFAELLAHHLLECAGYRLDANGITRPDGVTVPLAAIPNACGRLAQEDWLLLSAPGTATESVLIAGCLCFPAHWNLPDKIGKPLTRVHDPVPDYAETLAPRVNRVFAALHPDRPLQRLNWSLATTESLHCPTPHERRVGETPQLLRVERQTLRRLPTTRAIVFGVKTYLTPLANLPTEARKALVGKAAALSPEMADYKGGTDYLARLG